MIDVRDKTEYEEAHIPEAIHIQLSQLKEAEKKLDKSYFYVTACGKGGGRSAEAAKILKEMGLRAKWLCGGTKKWLEVGAV
ncbi:MAG: rhodanese-like domain-containing protein [Aquirufa sp.]